MVGPPCYAAVTTSLSRRSRANRAQLAASWALEGANRAQLAASQRWTSAGSGGQPRNDFARRNDFKTWNCDAIEVAVPCYQDVSATVLGELDQVVVTAISRHHPGRVDWVGEPDR